MRAAKVVLEYVRDIMSLSGVEAVPHSKRRLHTVHNLWVIPLNLWGRCIES
jgi:hypothetical protein